MDRGAWWATVYRPCKEGHKEPDVTEKCEAWTRFFFFFSSKFQLAWIKGSIKIFKFLSLIFYSCFLNSLDNY